MAWKATGRPTVRKQRDRWVVRVDGLDIETGKARPRQLGTFTSARAAKTAAAEFAASGDIGTDRSTVGHLVDEWVAGRTDIAPSTKVQYEWAATQIRAGLGSLRVEFLDRGDVARWLEELANEGRLARRSIGVVRMVLRAALADAVEAGDLRRSPAARVAMPRQVVKPDREREADAWTEDELRRFLASVEDHRWGIPIRVATLYGLRRSELLGLRWSGIDVRRGTIRVERGLVEVHGRKEWSDGKNARSRRTIPIDPDTARALAGHRRRQAEERLAAGPEWEEHDLVVTTRLGRPVAPSNFDQTLGRLVDAVDVPRLTSHGLRHTAATHMVRHASDIGEIRAAADLLGHSPDMLMKVYAHAMPESVRTVTDKIGGRAGKVR